ncbi:hypothetical protein Poli38472_003610 [Pythium oligandrum]|uniref:Uncharacterized protein n=1 Tax=Pythium oligandrum TaxID=41045 RepID=A0A8K1CM66_PYTOL|nr:hypothetical protein Poli38472_003610 [Pythium oligandrum]|eukprot:TMW65845.1 hypothetical protein Poli38472_003610 [Pythium oligandrum]
MPTGLRSYTSEDTYAPLAASHLPLRSVTMLDLRETLSGVVGAFCCVYAGLPFEVVKVRLQTQGEPKIYHNVPHAFRRIATEEGVVSLWKGAVPALSSSIIENSVLFSVNGIARRGVLALHAGRKVATDNSDYELTTMDEALMGAFSGIFSATAITPAEVIKCKLQFQRGRLGKGEYSGPFDCLRKVVRQEGVPGLFRGLSALLLRDVPFNFFFFGCYEAYTSAFASALGKASKEELNPLFILTAGGMAGATGWSVVFPADVLKSYMQTAASAQQGASKTALGLTATARLVYAQHGLHGFYRGWTAAVLRSFPANGSLFLGVEMTHRFFRYFDAQRAA